LEFHVSKEQNLLEVNSLPSVDKPWHFTASAVVIESGHILLVHHKRIGAWVPPGGHIDGNELPHQAAVRETHEETGVKVSIISAAMPQTNKAEAFFLPQPLCMHAVHAVEKGVELFHVDIAYLCRPENVCGSELPEVRHTDEVHTCQWFLLSELGKIPLANNVPEIVELATRRLECR
jgi:8-oxo-dGTP pyrophosphatase MutT (NUDIX family)